MNLTERVHKLLHEQRDVHNALSIEGPALIERLLWERGISLRELGRRCGLSAAYLSQVRLRQTTISASAFLGLSQLTKPNEKRGSQ